MRPIVIATLIAAIAATATGGAAAAKRHPILVAKVGRHDAFKISLTFPNGRPVRSIRAGTYTFDVHDYSKIHNFALGSPTQHRRIFTGSIPKIYRHRYTVTLKPGVYVYACSEHPYSMNGRFVVKP